jgi:hypothetical protein
VKWWSHKVQLNGFSWVSAGTHLTRFPLAPEVRKTYEFAHVAAGVPTEQSFSGTDDTEISFASSHFPVRSPDLCLQAPDQALRVPRLGGGL